MNRDILERIQVINGHRIPNNYVKGTFYLKPKEWLEYTLDNLIISSDYGTSDSTNSDVGIPVLRMGNMKNGKIDTNDLVFLELNKEQFEKLKLNKGDILFNRTNSYDLVGKVSLFNIEGDYICASYIVRFKIDNSLIDSRYVAYFMNLPKAQKYIKVLATKGVQQVNVNPTTLKKYFKIAFPKSLEEQKKIIDIIDNWDKSIELKEKLLQEKQKQKKGLMERLFSEKVKLKGRVETWKKVKLSDILEVRNDKSQITDKLELFSLTIEDGVTPKTDRYNREFLVKEEDKKYKITKYNDIVYNPANLRFGAITLNKVRKDVLLSPIYETLYIKDSTKYDIDFIGAILTSDNQIKRFSTMAEGTLVERMSVKVKDFISFNIKVPNSIEEQKEISSIINSSQKEIDLIKEEIELLKEQKNGLMQLLLTGIVRVNCD